MTLDIQKMAEQAGIPIHSPGHEIGVLTEELQEFANLVLQEAKKSIRAELSKTNEFKTCFSCYAHDCNAVGRALNFLQFPQDSATPTAPQQQRR